MPRSLLWPDPRVKPPFGAAEIDWGHPLALGIEFLCLFNALGGGDVELVRGIPGVPANSLIWAARSIMGIDLSGTAFVSYTGTPDAPFIGPISVVWRGIIDTGSAYRDFITKHTGNGTVAAPLTFRTDNSAAPRVAIGRARGATNYKTWRSGVGETLTLGTIQSAGASYADAQTHSTIPLIYRNGIPASGVAPEFEVGTNGTVTGSSDPIRIGRRQDGVTQMDGLVETVGAWSVEMPAAYFGWLHAEPYAMLRPIVRRRYFVPAAAGFDASLFPHLTYEPGMVGRVYK